STLRKAGPERAIARLAASRQWDDKAAARNNGREPRKASARAVACTHSFERRTTSMVTLLFRVSVALGLAGMALGIAMGIRQDFALAAAHAHLNLLGFVALFLAALYYRVVPAAAAIPLARTQAVVAVAGAIVFPSGIAGVM